jgi:hypothetical protein
MNVQKFGSRLQQQPARLSDPRQQQAGSTDFQSRPRAQQGDDPYGEGSFKASRDYQRDFGAYLRRTADLQRGDTPRPTERKTRELEDVFRLRQDRPLSGRG